MSQNKSMELAREIALLFEDKEEVILDTNDIQQFLSGDRTVDSVEAMEIIREICRQHDWESFVFDYGALVRFTRRNTDTLRPGQPSSDSAAVKP